MWYLVMSNLEDDEESQRNGYVVIRYSVDVPQHGASPLHLEYISKASVLTKSIPLQVKGFHFCSDNDALKPIMSSIQLFLGKERRARFRAHCGTGVECCYGLTEFGIKKNILPFKDFEGTLKDGWYEEVIQRQTQLELNYEQSLVAAHIPPDGKILYPKINDILLGRGRPQQEYPGNLKLASIVESRREEYSTASKQGKTRKATEVVSMIKAYGGRFLKKADHGPSSTMQHQQDQAGGSQTGYWVEVLDTRVAREKVSHSFRSKLPKQTAMPSSSALSSLGTKQIETTKELQSNGIPATNLPIITTGIDAKSGITEANGKAPSSIPSTTNLTGAVSVATVLSAAQARKIGTSEAPGAVNRTADHKGHMGTIPTSWVLYQYANMMGDIHVGNTFDNATAKSQQQRPSFVTSALSYNSASAIEQTRREAERTSPFFSFDGAKSNDLDLEQGHQHSPPSYSTQKQKQRHDDWN